MTSLLLLPGMDGTGLLFRALQQSLLPDVRATVVEYPRDEPLGYDELLQRCAMQAAQHIVEFARRHS